MVPTERLQRSRKNGSGGWMERSPELGRCIYRWREAVRNGFFWRWGKIGRRLGLRWSSVGQLSRAWLGYRTAVEI